MAHGVEEGQAEQPKRREPSVAPKTENQREIGLAHASEFDILINMKVLFVTAIVLASAASLWAQGQIFEGSMEIQRYVADSSTVDLRMAPSELLTFSSSNWLPPRASPASVGFSHLEAYRVTSGDALIFPPLSPSPAYAENSSGVEVIEASGQNSSIDVPVMPPLSPMPLAGSSSSFTLDVQSQSPLTIQAVPEPSAFALGGLAVGLAVVIARQRLLLR